MVDDKVVKSFKGVLKDILELELRAGNKIMETYESKDSSFPMRNATIISLDKPFGTPIRNDLANIEYRDINDPHYRKAEYFDEANRQFLCCKFDWP